MERKNEAAVSWLDTAVGGIRFGPDRAAVREELEAHMEDKAADLQRIFPGISREEAEERALSEMGDPAEIGKELARVHKPWLGWLWRASGVLLALVLIAFLGLNFALGDDAFLGDDSDAEFWDFDAMPFDRGRMDWYETTYLHGEDPGQLLFLRLGKNGLVFIEKYRGMGMERRIEKRGRQGLFQRILHAENKLHLQG